MANTLNNMSIDILSQKTLDTLITVLPRVKDIMVTDFSPEIASGGETVLSRIAIQPTSSEVPAAGYGAHAQDGKTTGISIKLGKIEGITLSFTDEEWTKKQMDIMEIFIVPAVNAVANAMVNKVLSICTADNFSSESPFVETFDSDSLADVRQTLVNLKARGTQYCMLNPALFTKLLKDPSVKNASKSGTDQVIKWAKIDTLVGFNPIMEYADIPSSLNIAGIAGGKQALCLAARAPADPGSLFTGELSSVTDPDSGFSMQLRKWYDPTLGKYFLGIYTIMGAACGQKNALTRITYAATKPSEPDTGA